MLMANGILTGNDDLENQNDKNEVIKTKSVDFEGRGTVACHLCKKSFILKTLLKRHYITCHSYDPQCPSAITSSPDSKFCKGGVISEGIFNRSKKKSNHCPLSFYYYRHSKWDLVGYSGGSPGLENAVNRWGRPIGPICFSVYFDASRYFFTFE